MTPLQFIGKMLGENIRTHHTSVTVFQRKRAGFKLLGQKRKLYTMCSLHMAHSFKLARTNYFGRCLIVFITYQLDFPSHNLFPKIKRRNPNGSNNSVKSHYLGFYS